MTLILQEFHYSTIPTFVLLYLEINRWIYTQRNDGHDCLNNLIVIDFWKQTSSLSITQFLVFKNAHKIEKYMTRNLNLMLCILSQIHVS